MAGLSNEEMSNLASGVGVFGGFGIGLDIRVGCGVNVGGGVGGGDEHPISISVPNTSNHPLISCPLLA